MISKLRVLAAAVAVSALASTAVAETPPAAAAPPAAEAAPPPAEAAPAAPPAAAPPAAAPTPPAAAPAAAPGSLIPAPPPGKGEVVFFRRGEFVGAAITYKVREGTTAYGTLSPARYFFIAADPGKHTYAVHSEAKDELTLEVDAGETYYVEGTVAMGVMVGRPNLAPSTEGAFNAVSAKLKLAKPEAVQASAAGAH